MDLAGCKAAHESRFLSEDLVVYHPIKGSKQVFVFDRSKAPLVHTPLRSGYVTALASAGSDRRSGGRGGDPGTRGRLTEPEVFR